MFVLIIEHTARHPPALEFVWEKLSKDSPQAALEFQVGGGVSWGKSLQEGENPSLPAAALGPHIS